jgi:hypothetical protein
MNKKLIVCLIFIGSFVTMFSTYKVSAEYKINNNEIISIENFDFIEVIDQQQISSSGLGCPFFSYLWLGQGFIPSLNTLTRLEVKLFKSGNPTSPITISIRDSLSGNDLTCASIDGSLVTQYGTWIEFDFPDISVTPGVAYYIICRTSGGSMISYYCAEFDTNDPYPKGEAWGSINYGASWELIEDYYPEYSDPDACFKIYGLDQSPSTPTISGETNGNVGKEYTYSILSTDPEDHDLYYYVKWGDDTSSGWIGPCVSGETVELKHIWQTKGTYIIEVKAKDSFGAESDWVKLQVTMPKNKAINTPFLQFFYNFLHSHPNLFPILQKIIQRLGLQ